MGQEFEALRTVTICSVTVQHGMTMVFHPVDDEGRRAKADTLEFWLPEDEVHDGVQREYWKLVGAEPIKKPVVGPWDGRWTELRDAHTTEDGDEKIINFDTLLVQVKAIVNGPGMTKKAADNVAAAIRRAKPENEQEFLDLLVG